MVATSKPLSLRCVDLRRPDAEATADLREACSTSGIFQGPTRYFAVPFASASADCHCSDCDAACLVVTDPAPHLLSSPQPTPLPIPCHAVSNHALGDLIERHFEQTRAFFSLSMKRKMDIMIDSHHRCMPHSAAPHRLSLQSIRMPQRH